MGGLRAGPHVARPTPGPCRAATQAEGARAKLPKGRGADHHITRTPQRSRRAAAANSNVRTSPRAVKMSSESSRSNPPLQAAHPIDFVIIGGGIAGLACAVALRRVGHRALVLERRDRTTVCSYGGVRLPPNCTKILFHWGLRNALLEKSLITHTLLFTQYENGEYLGAHQWDEGILKETRGLFLLTTHADLYDIMHDAAIAHGVEIRWNTQVEAIEADRPAVVLASGEVVTGDVLVGADGEVGVSRAKVAGERARGRRTGLAIYDSIFPLINLNAHSGSRLDRDNAMVAAFGTGRAIIAYPLHGGVNMAFQWYGPDDGPEGFYGDPPSEDVHSKANPQHITLQLVMSDVQKASRISIRKHDDLEDWIAPGSRLGLIGEAAHPFPPGTIQATAMAIEDGAVLAKLFSHLLEPRQIVSFLYAFQELRQARTSQIHAHEFSNVYFVTLTDAALVEKRNNAMRAKAAAGENVLGGSDGVASKVWDQVEMLFGYDCEDEADNWWIRWGVLRERALERGGVGRAAKPVYLGFDFSKLAVQVNKTTVEEANS
ncbi:FAD/NAD-P-binding domain-containing protein [Trametes elegans]|nr:FAD/NAD-P-binding domain-containing protein [Trametes elegans]